MQKFIEFHLDHEPPYFSCVIKNEDGSMKAYDCSAEDLVIKLNPFDGNNILDADGFLKRCNICFQHHSEIEKKEGEI